MDETDLKVRHIITDKEDEIRKFRGSKYTESSISGLYPQIQELLISGNHVLFSGTPCQISGLKSYLGKEYENLLCIEVVCHGVSSQKLWEKYIFDKQKKEHIKIRQMYFRSKKYSWKDYGILEESTDKKQKFHFSFEDPYFRLFNSNLCLRPSCYNCKTKGSNSVSDISLGDFWNIEKYNNNLDDGKGISMIVVNSLKGETVLNQIKEGLVMEETDLSFNEAVKFNPAVEISMPVSNQRKSFYQDMNRMDFYSLSYKYSPTTIKIKIKAALKHIKYYLKRGIIRRI